MTPPVESKAALRRTLRAHRRGVPHAERTRRDAAIQAHLQEVLGSRGSAVVAFSPLPGEPGGQDLPDVLMSAGHRVILPRIEPLPSIGANEVRGTQDQHLVWVECTQDNLRPGTWEIPEPTGAPLELHEASAAVIVVPALAISFSGARLGQGGGFYDRALQHRNRLPTPPRLCAVVDDEEFLPTVPCEEHDLRVDSVVTPSRLHIINT